jgi:hypothetical protein
MNLLLLAEGKPEGQKQLVPGVMRLLVDVADFQVMPIIQVLLTNQLNILRRLPPF